jgi:phenylacetate-coenzyme A ligase PaaK-like adenylate-forming protein
VTALGYRRVQLGDVAAALRQARGLAQRERWPRERIEAERAVRAGELARFAAARSPFWRSRLRGALRDDGSLELAAVAPLGKAELMECWDDAVTDRRLRRDELLAHLEALDDDALWLGEYRAMATSGSSGLKGLSVYDRAAWRGLVAQFFRYNQFAGVKPRLPRRLRIAAIGGGAPTHMTRRVASTVAVGIHRVLSLPVTLPLPKLVAALNDYRPDFVNCYPSVAVLLADEQIAGRLRIAPSAMSTSSEWRSPEATPRIEEAFGIHPTDLYGTTEGLWGATCEHRAMHLFDDMCIVENVDADGRPVPAGERGERLLVTNLFNRAQPLIRFELGDVTTLSAAACACGRALTVLESIDGRAEDVLRLRGADGPRVPVHPVQFGVVPADRDVREYQVVQRGERVNVRVVLVPGADGRAAAARIGDGVRAVLAAAGVAAPDVAVEVCDALERSAAGKLATVVADQRLENGVTGRGCASPSTSMSTNSL